MKKQLWFLAVFFFAVACRQKNDTGFVDCTCPYATIYLQPYDNYTQKEANKLKAELHNHLQEILFGAFEVKVLPNKPLSDSFLGGIKGKYRTDKIINDLKENADEHNIYIGITHRDICRDYKNGVKDWGVLGSSIADYHACVASDYRIKNKKRDMWKVVTHEFIHTFHGYPHCPKDSAHCIMKDAKGHADFSNKYDLCGYCKDKIG